MISRLKIKGYSSLIIKKTLHYLQENGYINDKEFVRLFVASKQEKGWGQIKICLGLKRLGVSEDLIDEATKDKNLFTEKLRDLINKKIYFYKGPDKYHKILKYLASRGFRYSDIRDILEEIGIKKFKD
jgi:SOS response regulatory protein OraA/RecX